MLVILVVSVSIFPCNIVSALVLYIVSVSRSLITSSTTFWTFVSPARLASASPSKVVEILSILPCNTTSAASLAAASAPTESPPEEIPTTNAASAARALSLSAATPSKFSLTATTKLVFTVVFKEDKVPSTVSALVFSVAVAVSALSILTPKASSEDSLVVASESKSATTSLIAPTKLVVKLVVNESNEPSTPLALFVSLRRVVSVPSILDDSALSLLALVFASSNNLVSRVWIASVIVLESAMYWPVKA